MTIGLKNLVVAQVVNDDDTGTVYEDVIKLVGAIDANVNPESADADAQYADDVEFDSITPDADYTVDLETTGLTIEQMALLQGADVDGNGGMIVKSGNEPPYFAVGFMAEKSKKAGGGYRHVWLYKCKPQLLSHTYHTKEGKTVTRQTGKISLRSVARISDGMKQYVIDKAIDGFFDAPYEPVAIGDGN